MKLIKYFLIPLLIIVFSQVSCKKEPGLTGKKVLSGMVQYKNVASGLTEAAPSAIVRVAFDANSPVSQYDLSILADSEGKYAIRGLEKGNYFLTAEFKDSHGFEYSCAGYALEINNKKDELVVDITLE